MLIYRIFFNIIVVYIFILSLSLQLDISIITLLSKIIKSYYFPFIHSAKIGSIANRSFHIYAYGCLVFMILTNFLVQFFLNRSKRRVSGSFYHMITMICFTFAFLIISLQTVNHWEIFALERNLFAHKSVDEKNKFIQKEPYRVASYFKKIYSGKHRGKFITDMDILREPHMGKHRKFSYYLYPTIDIRNINTHFPVDCIVFFSKKNAEKYIPDDFILQGAYDSSNVLAVNKKDIY